MSGALDRLGKTLAGFIVLAIGPLLELRAQELARDALASELPRHLDCHGFDDDWVAQWRPAFFGADAQLMRTSTCSGFRTFHYVAQYATQSQGKEAVNDLNYVVPREWRSTATRAVHRSGNGFEVTEYILPYDDGAFVVWTWFSVGGQPIRAHLDAKMLETWNAIRLRSEVTSAVVIAVEARDAESARAVLATQSGALQSWIAAAQ